MPRKNFKFNVARVYRRRRAEYPGALRVVRLAGKAGRHSRSCWRSTPTPTSSSTTASPTPTSTRTIRSTTSTKPTAGQDPAAPRRTSVSRRYGPDAYPSALAQTNCLVAEDRFLAARELPLFSGVARRGSRTALPRALVKAHQKTSTKMIDFPFARVSIVAWTASDSLAASRGTRTDKELLDPLPPPPHHATGDDRQHRRTWLRDRCHAETDAGGLDRRVDFLAC